MKYIFFSLSIFFTLISCKKEIQNIEKTGEPRDNELVITRTPMNVGAKNAHELKYRMILPETLKVNEPYKAVIEFESDFDTIVDPVQFAVKLDSTKPRVIQFYRYKPKKLSEKDIEEYVIIDSTFVSNKQFTVENIVFKEKGEYLFQGYLFDEIMYNFYNDKGKRDSIHFDQRRQMITKKVVVVE